MVTIFAKALIRIWVSLQKIEKKTSVGLLRLLNCLQMLVWCASLVSSLLMLRIVIMLDEFMKGPACLFLKYLWMLLCMSVNKEMLRDCIRKPELEKLKALLGLTLSMKNQKPQSLC